MFQVGPLTPHERMIRSKILLQRNHPFFAYIIMHFEMRNVSSDKLPTMGVNQYGDLYWNSDFVTELTEDGLLYVLCHEVMHIAKSDVVRRGQRIPFIWNVAADCIINDMLNQEGFVFPVYTQKLIDLLEADVSEDQKKEKLYKPPKIGEPIGFCPERDGSIVIAKKKYQCRDKTTEELYDELVENIEFIQIEVAGGGGSDSGQNGDEQSGSGSGSRGSKKHGRHGGFDCHMDEDSDEDGESSGKCSGQASLNKQESRWRKITVEAAIQAKERGTSPGFAEQLVGEILEPKVDWRSRVRSMITNEIPFDFETRLPGRGFYATRVWAPKMFKENVNLMISIDCSGSTMGDREKFLSEIQGIVTAHPNVKARLICWDTRVDPKNDLEIDTKTVDKLKKLNLSNVNGGTELSAYCDYVEEKGYTSRVHIHLTDGYIEQLPRLPNGRHLFVLCGSHTDEILRNYGECICIKDQYD